MVMAVTSIFMVLLRLVVEFPVIEFWYALNYFTSPSCHIYKFYSNFIIKFCPNYG